MEKVILIGTEGFGAQWPKPCELNGLKITSIVDNNLEALESAKRKLDIPDEYVFDGNDFSWASVPADYVIEASAPGGRCGRVLAALEAGKNVIMAKPPVLCIEDFERIMETKTKLHREVHVVTQKRYFPAFHKIKEIIETEDLGPLIYAEINLRVDGTYWKSGFHWRKKLPYPSLIDGSIHHFDLLRWWTGLDYKDVFAGSWNPDWSPFENDCDFHALLTMSNGATVNYTSRWSMKHGPVINYFEGIRLEFWNAVLEVNGGKLYNNGTYIPIPCDGTALMDTGELNIFILADILKSIRTHKDDYQTSMENHIIPFTGVMGCIASILNEKKILYNDLTKHLEEFGINKVQIEKMMEHVFDKK